MDAENAHQTRGDVKTGVAGIALKKDDVVFLKAPVHRLLQKEALFFFQPGEKILAVQIPEIVHTGSRSAPPGD